MAEASPPPEAVAHDDLCPVCHLLLYDPVRTQCNHLLCGSCMAQWADASSTVEIMPSSLNLDHSQFDPNYDPANELMSLEANCPMCRSRTTASLDDGLKRILEARYPATYAERRAEEEAVRVGDSGVEGMVILIGNKHRLVSGVEEGNKHDWTFFVRLSRPEIVEEVRVHLHPTFRPPRVVLHRPPFEVRRLGWGFFNIEADIILKEPYSWVTDGDKRTRRPSLTLDWLLRIEGRGKQGRVRTKVRKIEAEQMDIDEHVDEGRASPVSWPHMEDEDL
ncbi:hypothetical protein CC78DRAFT_537984 [Lojkania enalia]|uniref:RING-type domain-containing protein n=1 Tax=Lojkania enalia TaxID=147567 RepID=A0A9P4JYU3_9PLEO|nr:hypothetical protein CC78DRAFT_537984 [Didymosphaeria enalia]